jgi:hypothetical protein
VRSERSCLLAACVAACLLALGCAAAGGRDGPAAVQERVLSLQEDIVVHDDLRLSVRETLTVLSAGAQIKHGIRRLIHTEYWDRSGGHHSLSFRVLDVTRDGEPAAYSLADSPGGTVMAIGDPAVPLAAGKHTYVVALEEDAAVAESDGRSELVYDAAGLSDGFATDQVQVNLELPAARAKDLRGVRAYVVPRGELPEMASVHLERGMRATVKSTRPLAPGEALRVIVTWRGSVGRAAAPDGRGAGGSTPAQAAGPGNER